MILTYMQVGIKACLARKDRRQVDGLESWLFLNFRPLGEEPKGRGFKSLPRNVVYRATDTKLNRDVALKILPQQFASDSQRMGRFQREAEVLASLDHPNIGQIYGIEDAGKAKALVLQLIEGPTLAEKIAQGPIPVEEALKIALQIAEGLEAAHEKGVIHRDLKPANVKITPEGQVKILDFG